MYITIIMSLVLSSCIKMKEECAFICEHYTNPAVGQKIVLHTPSGCPQAETRFLSLLPGTSSPEITNIHHLLP